MDVIDRISSMDKNSKFLLIIIGIISTLLILIFIINFLSSRKIRKQEKLRKAYKKKLIDEINNEAKNIEPIKKTSINRNISVSNDVVEEIKDEEIIEVLQDENESDVDRILKDIKEASKEEVLNLTEFEKEQEETAIISYDELCKRAGVKKKIYKTEKNEKSELITKTIENKEEKKYKPTKFVSPIYGIQKEKAIIDVNEEEDLEKTFLQSLKEFRSTLD